MATAPRAWTTATSDRSVGTSIRKRTSATASRSALVRRTHYCATTQIVSAPTNGAGVLNLCLERCHPLLQDCAEGQGCYLGYSGFLCVPQASGEDGAAYDSCEFLNVCDPGLVCVDGTDEEGCPSNAAGCCKTLCELGTSGSPCLPLEECVPWEWTDDDIPPELENIGQCKFPEL